MFQMFGVFSEFEHTTIRERVKAGTARAKAQQVAWSTAYLSSHRSENQIDAQAARRHGQDRPSTRLRHGDGPANQAPASDIKSSMTAV
jgi:DNA invertase Pin-like site-specific DNA recombinase